MRRINNLFQKIISIENLNLADQRASRGKSTQYGVQMHNRNREVHILNLHEMLNDKSFRTSAYKTFVIHEPKERVISSLPYFPDRIVHHAIMNVLEPIFVSIFTADTYSCIKGRGIHAALSNVKKALKDRTNTQFCLKLDIKKFYPNINHSILKQLLRKKFKDIDLLWLLDEIIDSAPGVPIGNYLSQYFANFTLTYFDHWLKATFNIAYFRYADDIVILHGSKQHLHAILAAIRQYFHEQLKLEIKGNYQIFPVDARGIDFVGYVIRHDYVRLRKGIKKSFARTVTKHKNRASVSSYKGWAMHGNCKHLCKKLLNESI